MKRTVFKRRPSRKVCSPQKRLEREERRLYPVHPYRMAQAGLGSGDFDLEADMDWRDCFMPDT